MIILLQRQKLYLRSKTTTEDKHGKHGKLMVLYRFMGALQQNSAQSRRFYLLNGKSQHHCYQIRAAEETSVSRNDDK